MVKSDIEKVLAQFAKAVSRFDEALSREPGADPLALDASTQRFEFCFELCWKLLKRSLLFQGIDATSPRDVFKEAFRQGWLSEGDNFWAKMIEDRNLTSHTYNEERALEIYSRFASYREAFSRIAASVGTKMLK